MEASEPLGVIAGSGRRIALFAVLAGLGVGTACRRAPPPERRALAPDPPLSAPWDPRDFKPGQRASVELLNKMRRPDWLQERNDRRELVLPAPAGFKPEAVDKKLKLTLRLREQTIHRGQKLWYRVEIQNLGRKPVFFTENESFLKDKRSISEGAFRLILAGPDASTRTLGFTPNLISGNEVELHLPGQERWTKEESTAIVANLNDYTRRARGLSVELNPGETLYSRTWRDVDWVSEFFRTRGGEVPPEPAPVEFRVLRTDYRFDQPGGYRLKAVLNDPGPDIPDEEQIAAMKLDGPKKKALLADYRYWHGLVLGVMESDEVAFEVGR